LSIRVIIPDSHGLFIDKLAKAAFLHDLKALDPVEIVMLGDHVDCSGLAFCTHKRSSVADQEYSYKRDIAEANSFLDEIQKMAPAADIHYLEGNHENRLERWAANTFDCRDDSEYILSRMSPSALLNLKQRGIRFYQMNKTYMGISSPGAMKLGKCFFTHGISCNKFATATHVERFGANVVHGHTHRAQTHMVRTVTAGEIGGWCPGTLSQLQPTYLHSSPSNWTHGYGLQFINRASGTFLHLNVPIVRGKSLLLELTNKIK